MPFFHLVVALEDEPAKTIAVFMDLSESDLKARFVAPYIQGDDLVSKNSIYSLRSIRRVHVIRTERRSELELEELQRSSREQIDQFNRESQNAALISLGYGYTAEDIIHAGRDVTESYIQGPPGTASRPSRVSAFLNSGWVVAIGGGLLVAALAWYLGWH